MWGGSSSRGTGEPGDTGELSLRAYGGFAAEHQASAARSGADVQGDKNWNVNHTSTRDIDNRHVNNI